jgi:hypothetical protein
LSFKELQKQIKAFRHEQFEEKELVGGQAVRQISSRRILLSNESMR